MSWSIASGNKSGAERLCDGCRGDGAHCDAGCEIGGFHGSDVCTCRVSPGVVHLELAALEYFPEDWIMVTLLEEDKLSFFGLAQEKLTGSAAAADRVAGESNLPE
ncbi:hypothetical protein [Plantibacter flavus]|uniref:hypothetical protein n=1 Tax=Plantibacter flavus TaxID=150123 RepID=UPI00339110E0